MVDGEYNERRKSCEEAARLLRIQSLREIGLRELEKRKSELPDLIYRRALHVVGETDRVERAVACLMKNDLPGFGRLLDESQESSRLNFENSIPALDKLCKASQNPPGHLGARLSGGGFGGFTLHLVEVDKKDQFGQCLKKLSKSFMARPVDLFTTRLN